MAPLIPTPHGSKIITNTKINQISTILSSSIPQLEPYDSLYRTFHANPELSGCEVETAARIALHLRQFSNPAFTIHETIGGHGIIAILENGAGETVLLRADMDALPIKERYMFFLHLPLLYSSKRKFTTPRYFQLQTWK